MDFETYLSEKKINSAAFKNNDPEKWEKLKELFDLVHPISFTVQKKFIINDLRRLYHLKEVVPARQITDNAANEIKKPARPVVKKAVIIKKAEPEA